MPSGTMAEARTIRFSAVDPELPSKIPTTGAYAESEKAQAAGRAFSEGVGGFGERVVALKAAVPHGATPNSVDKSIAAVGRMTFPRSGEPAKP